MRLRDFKETFNQTVCAINLKRSTHIISLINNDIR